MAYVRAAFCFVLGVIFAVEGIRGDTVYFALASVSFFLASTNLDLKKRS